MRLQKQLSSAFDSSAPTAKLLVFGDKGKEVIASSK